MMTQMRCDRMMHAWKHVKHNAMFQIHDQRCLSRVLCNLWKVENRDEGCFKSGLKGRPGCGEDSYKMVTVEEGLKEQRYEEKIELIRRSWMQRRAMSERGNFFIFSFPVSSSPFLYSCLMPNKNQWLNIFNNKLDMYLGNVIYHKCITRLFLTVHYKHVCDI